MGIRLVRTEAEIDDAYNSAKSEALANFANGTIYIEKFIENPHHIEFQIMGDKFGKSASLVRP